MPKQTYVIVSNCRFDRKWWKKGDKIELDTEEPADMNKIALLNHAGRIGLATPENIERVKSEIEADKANEKRLEEQAKRMSRPIAAAA